MKAKDTVCLNTIRHVNSEIKYQEIDLRRELEDDEIVALISSQIKKRKEAAILFEKGNRADLKENELKEISVLEKYLPEQVSEEELRARVQAVITEVGAEGPKDMGRVMKVLVPEYKGKADNSLIKELVTEHLGK